MLLQFYQVKKGDDQVSSTYALHPVHRNHISYSTSVTTSILLLMFVYIYPGVLNLESSECHYKINSLTSLRKYLRTRADRRKWVHKLSQAACSMPFLDVSIFSEYISLFWL